jgi:hypothetical protein
MEQRKHLRRGWPVLTGLAILLTACGHSSSATPTTPGPASSTSPASTGSSSPTQSAVPPQSPVPAESNPPGDIPDNTVYVSYSAKAGGLSFKVPEGWARQSTSTSVTFSSALNSISAAWTSASSAPTVSSAKSVDVPALQKSELAFALQSIKPVTLPGGSAVLITFQENSKPNSVTGKQYRLVILRFEFFKNGTEGVLSLSSPVGADNVDPWRIVSESFKWA